MTSQNDCGNDSNEDCELITCDKCSGECCKYVAVEIDTPETEEDFENIKWYLCHQNVVVYQDWEDSWLVEFQTKCKFLSEENQCEMYEKRPQMCRNHDVEECVMNGEGEPEKIIFRDVEDVEKFIEEYGMPGKKA